MNKQPDPSNRDLTGVQPLSQKKGALPRSIARTIHKLKADFSPQAEEQFVREFRISRNKTRAALRFLLLLVIVPLLTHNLSKLLLVSPIVERMRGENTPQIFLNYAMEEEALSELKKFEKKLRFQSLLHQEPSLSAEIIEEKVKEKAIEIAKEFREKSNSTISNVFANLISLIAFAVVVATSRREIAILKSFIDEIVYGISDSAKAFLIIMSTDIFVGFHSPDGWEVILEGVTESFGLPANRSAIFIFIATVPVILNSIFKYLIFNYLSRMSPSSLATMKEMDDS
ncbi:MAG: CemA family protein [Stigonema ocellatum SAG 48.90 = DSM 106950]|nr:CemA family protein [Stigonema ocellatum SAG 48.90 = DSM 106950]